MKTLAIGLMTILGIGSAANADPVSADDFGPATEFSITCNESGPHATTIRIAKVGQNSRFELLDQSRSGAILTATGRTDIIKSSSSAVNTLGRNQFSGDDITDSRSGAVRSLREFTVDFSDAGMTPVQRRENSVTYEYTGGVQQISGRINDQPFGLVVETPSQTPRIRGKLRNSRIDVQLEKKGVEHVFSGTVDGAPFTTTYKIGTECKFPSSAAVAIDAFIGVKDRTIIAQRFFAYPF